MVVEVLLIVLVAIPLGLAIPAIGFLNVGLNLHNKRLDDESIFSVFLQQLLKRRLEESETWWDSLGLSAEYAMQPGFLAKLFLYPGALFLWLLEQYLSLLLWPIRILWGLVWWPFHWLGQHHGIRNLIIGSGVLMVVLYLLLNR